jgi:hypothetical protein
LIEKKYWWLLLLPGLPIMAAWDRFIVPTGTRISDIMISHYPNLLLIQRSLASGQGIPLWSPLILSGYPFSANPLSTLWYPPAWLSLLFPLSLGINLVMVLHVLLGAAGFTWLLHRMQLSNGVAILGGILFGLLPAGYSHVAAGHFTWVCASAWFPWLLVSSLFENKGVVKRTLLTAVSLGMMMLADLRFAAYGGLFWLVFSLYQSVVSKEDTFIKMKWKALAFAGGGLILAIGISAVVWLPLMEYANLSTRSLMTAQDALYLSLPVVQLTGFVVPGHPASVEWIMYPGAACLLLALISISLVKERKDILLWLGMAVVFLVWTMGDAIPFNKVLMNLPGISLLRVPARGLFFCSVAFLLGAMTALDQLLKRNPEKAVYLRLATIFFAVMVVLLQVVIIMVNPEKNGFLIWHVAFWLFTAGLIIGYSYRKLTGTVFLIMLGITAVLDLFVSDINLIGFRSSADVFSEGIEEAEFISGKDSNARVFSPCYSIPQQTAATHGIELADGIDPLQIMGYSNFVYSAASIPLEGYSVTLPPFATGETETDNVGIKPDAKAFGLLNVRYLISAFPISEDGWLLTHQTQTDYIYENQYARGWAWLENDGIINRTNSDGMRVARQPNRIEIEATGPGRLVLSEVIYPGWQVWIDGQPEDIQTAHSILRSVELSDGHHVVEFHYVPVRLYTGILVSLISILVCIVIFRKYKQNA